MDKHTPMTHNEPQEIGRVIANCAECSHTHDCKIIIIIIILIIITKLIIKILGI